MGLSLPSMALEKLLSQIPGVEHIYSRSGTSQAVVTLPFFVGEDREDALLNVLLNPQSMTAHHTAAIDILQAIKVSNQLLD